MQLCLYAGKIGLLQLCKRVTQCLHYAEPLPTPKPSSARKANAKNQAAAADKNKVGSLEGTLINNTLIGRDMTVRALPSCELLIER